MFVGRSKEKKEILEHLYTDKFEYLLVYGIRRVGKTKLINECLSCISSRVITYTFRDVPGDVNVKEFSSYISAQFDEPYISFNDLGKCLAYLGKKAENEKLILFLDEYPFLRRDNSGIDSYFQDLKNRNEDTSNLKIIFCGSYANIMLKMIDADAPLYGRFSYILNLLPFDYYESSIFMENVSNEDKFKYYACFGGLGFTLSNIDFNKSFIENIKSLLIRDNSLFEREVLSIVNQEINKIPEAKYLLELIANKTNKYSDINNEFKRIKSGNNVSYLLTKLKELELIDKVSIINEKKMKSDYYVVKDNLIDFYYSFLSKKVSERSYLSENDFYKQIEEKLEKEYFPKKFENVSKQFLIKMNKEGKLNNKFSTIGRLIYHDKTNKKNGEFDIVIKDEANYTDIECKYLNRKLSINDYNNEKKQLIALGFSDVNIGFISKCGFDDSFPKDILHFELNDFYKQD